MTLRFAKFQRVYIFTAEPIAVKSRNKVLIAVEGRRSAAITVGERYKERDNNRGEN